MNNIEFKAFDNLNTEIIILDGVDFKLLWINDAAKAANWIGDSSKFEGKTISSLLNEETGLEINKILKKSNKNSGSVTKRDFEIIHQSGTVRTVDLTITFSEKKNMIFLEAVSIDHLNKIIDSLEFNNPVIPLIGNVTAEPLVTAEEVKSEFKMQLTSCVQWNNSVKNMIGDGISSFIEIGNGKILSGMIKRINRDAKITNISDFDSVLEYAAS